MNDERLPPRSIQDFVRLHLPVDGWSRPSGRSEEAEVWAIHAKGDIVAYLKQHAHRGKVTAEQRAYLDWGCDLTGLPQWIAVSDVDPTAMLISAAPGIPVHRGRWDDKTWNAMFRAAGAFARNLHDLDRPDEDRVPLGHAMVKRADAWCARLDGVAPPGLLRAIQTQVLPVFQHRDWQRVPCHRDYQTRNWLLDPSQKPLGFSVIDFGQSRQDLWLADLVPMHLTDWQRDPTTREAFFEGYERAMTKDEWVVLDALAVLHCLGTVTWGLRSGNATTVRHGRRTLRRLLLPGSRLS